MQERGMNRRHPKKQDRGWRIWRGHFIQLVYHKPIRLCRNLREFKLGIFRGAESVGDHGYLASKLLKSLKKPDLEKFTETVLKLSKQGQLEDAAIFRAPVRRPNLVKPKNVLEMMFSMENDETNSPEEYYTILKNHLTDWGFVQLLERTDIPAYAIRNPDLALRVLRDCDDVFGAAEVFLEKSDGKNILHSSAKENPALFEELIRKLDECTQIHITIDYLFFVLLFSLLANLTLLPLGRICVHINQVADMFLYAYFLAYHPYIGSKYLNECDSKGNSVLRVAAENGCSQIIRKFAETYSEKSAFQNVLKCYWNYYKKGFSQNIQYAPGFIITIVVTYFAHYSMEQVILSNILFRFFRNLIAEATLFIFWKLGYLPKDLTFIAYLMRTAIQLNSFNGYWYSIGDHLVVLVVAYIVLHLTLRNLRAVIKLQNNDGRTFLADAKEDDLKLWLFDPPPVLCELKLMDIDKDLYKYLCERPDISQETRLKVKSMIKDEEIVDPKLTNVISNISRVKVIVMVCEKNRPYAEKEKQDIQAMCRARNFSYQGCYPIIFNSDYEEAVDRILVNTDPGDTDMLMVFVATHGANGYLFANDPTNGLAVQKIIDRFWNHNSRLKDLPKVLVIQACQNEPQRANTNTSDSDPVAMYADQRDNIVRIDEEHRSYIDAFMPNNFALLMSAKPGEPAVCDTFLEKIAMEFSYHKGYFIDLNRMFKRVRHYMMTKFSQEPVLYQRMDKDLLIKT